MSVPRKQEKHETDRGKITAEDAKAEPDNPEFRNQKPEFGIADFGTGAAEEKLE